MPDREHQRAAKRENSVGAVCEVERRAQDGYARGEDTEVGPTACWERTMQLGRGGGEGEAGQQQEEEDKNLSKPVLLQQTRLFVLNRNQCQRQCQCQCQCREHQRQRIGRVAADAEKCRWFAADEVEVVGEVVRQDGYESEVVVDNAQWRQCWCCCCQTRMRESAAAVARLDLGGQQQGPGRAGSLSKMPAGQQWPPAPDLPDPAYPRWHCCSASVDAHGLAHPRD